MGTRLQYVQRHGKGFRGWYMANGRQQRGPTFPTEEEAHRWALERRENGPEQPGGELTLGGGMDLVRRSIERKRRRDGTLRWYEGQFRILARAWDLSIPLAKLDKRQVDWFIERRAAHEDPDTGQRLTASTIRANLRALGRICMFESGTSTSRAASCGLCTGSADLASCPYPMEWWSCSSD